MIDPLGSMLAGITGGRANGLPFAILAGLATSVGPCVAPRYLALATLVGHRRPFVPVLAFVGGIVVAYVALGSTAAIVGAVIANVAAIDVVLAVALIAGGLATIIAEPHACAHAIEATPARSRASGAFALGAGSALVISPCCTPLLAAFAGLGAFDRDPLLAGAYLAAFALGHAAPLALAGVLGGAFAHRIRRLTATAAPAVVSGTLMIALGAYYGVLA